MFREEALDKRTSTDQLDRLLRVTEPRDWLWLGGLLIFGVWFVAWACLGWIKLETHGVGVLHRANHVPWVVATTSGVVKEIMVTRQQNIKAGDKLVSIQRPDGAVIDIVASTDGMVNGILAQQGMYVEAGTVLLVTRRPNSPVVGDVFVPLSAGHVVQVGMEVRCAPESTRSSQYGLAIGRVTAIDAIAANAEEIRFLLQNAEEAKRLLASGSWVHITIELDPDPSTPSGLKWSTGVGPPWELWDRNPCQVTFLFGSQHPIELFLGIGAPSAK